MYVVGLYCFPSLRLIDLFYLSILLPLVMSCVVISFCLYFRLVAFLYNHQGRVVQSWVKITLG